MTTKSKAFRIGEAFGKKGVLSKASQVNPESLSDRDDFSPYWDSGGTYLTRPTYSAAQSFTAGDSGGARVTNRITLTPTAVDPEGFPLTYSVDVVPSNPNQLDSVSVTGNSFVFTPAYGILGDSQNNTGTFKARIRASDGVRDVLDLVDFSIVYSVPITFSLVNSGTGWASGGADATVTTGKTDYTNMLDNSGGGIGQLNQTAGAALSSPLPLGKKYFEFKFTNKAGYMHQGLMAQATVDGAGTTTNGENNLTGTYENANVISCYHYNGNEYKGNTGSGYSIGAWDHTDILMIAYDTTSRGVWFGLNGSWNATYSPITGTTSGVLAGGSTDQPRFYYGGASSGSDGWKGYTMRSTDLTYTPPTGYSSV